MNSREIIRRCIEFTGPERIGYDFRAPHPSDLIYAGPGRGTGDVYEEEDPEIRRQVPDFPGQLYRDPYGSIWGRLNDRHSGEVVKGVLQDGWELLDSYTLPDLDAPHHYRPVAEAFAACPDLYHVGVLPGFPFAIMRYMRRMDHFLMDVLLHEQEVLRLNGMVVEMLLACIDNHARAGADAVTFAEDWGTQDRLLISPATWRRLFKPSFRVLVDRAHEQNLHVIMHSCGYIYEIIKDLIEVGIDALQLDQPELMGVERLAHDFGGRIAFYCPVDIQKVMQTGDREIIQREARRMVELFGGFGGGFIAKDYPQWEAIGVPDEWAQWARDAFMGLS